MNNKIKNYMTKNKLTLFGVLWLLSAPLILCFLISASVFEQVSTVAFYTIIIASLAIGGVAIGYAYYAQHPRLNQLLRVLLLLIISVFYCVVGFYYFALLSVLFALS